MFRLKPDLPRTTTSYWESHHDSDSSEARSDPFKPLRDLAKEGEETELSSVATDNEAQDKRSDPATPSPSLPQSLPSEILVHVFTYARELCAPEGAALRFVSKLGRVCKAWRAPAQAVIFRKLYIRKGPALLKVTDILEKPCAACLAAAVTSLDVLIPAPARLARHAGSWNEPFHSRHDPSTRSSRDGGKILARLVRLLPELRTVRLHLKKGETTEGGEASWSADHAPFPTLLEPALVKALAAHLKKVEFLQLNYCVDFEDLSLLFRSLHALKTLHLSGISSLRRDQTLAPSEAHCADKLTNLSIGIHEGKLKVNSLSVEQLLWLVKPAIATRSLKEVTLCLPTAEVFGLRRTPAVPAFASGEFADALIDLKVLEKLDLLSPGDEQEIFNSLEDDPHNGTLDYAISHLTSLRELSLPAHLVGDTFLSAVSSLPALKSLSVFGWSGALDAQAVLAAVGTSFPALCELSLHGQMSSPARAAAAWSAEQRREVYRAAGARGILIEVTEMESDR